MAEPTPNLDTVFATLVDAILANPGKDHESRRLREWQPVLHFAARHTQDTDTLVNGLYELRHFVAEGGDLYTWISNFSMALTRPMSPLQRLRLQVAQAWHLIWVGSHSTAGDIIRVAERELLPLTVPGARTVHVPTRLVELDLATYRLILHSLHSTGNEHVDEALHYRNEAEIFGRPAQRNRLELALGAVKFRQGRIKQAESNADRAYRYFAPRNMNTEAGFAAFGLGRIYSAMDDIDPLDHPASGIGLYWLSKAALHFSLIGLPYGLKLVEPFIRNVDIELKEFANPKLIAPYALPLQERFSRS